MPLYQDSSVARGEVAHHSVSNECHASVHACVAMHVCIDAVSSDQPEISPSEANILDCMMNGGLRLDLKARFLSQLPDLSTLARTLTHLNLSFNCLYVSAIYKAVTSKFWVVKP